MEGSVYMDKVPVHTVYDPVRYRRPGKLHPELEPVLFLPVQGQRKAIFLIDAPWATGEDAGLWGSAPAGPKTSQIYSCSGSDDILLYRPDIYKSYGNISPV